MRGSLLLSDCCFWTVLSTARVLLKFRRNTGWNRRDCVQDGTQTHTCLHTQRRCSWLSKRDDLEARLLRLPRRLSSLDHDLITDTGAADNAAQKDGINCTALCCVPTVLLAVGYWVRVHTRTHSRTRRSTVHGCHKGKLLKCGCCCTVAVRVYTS